MADFASEFINEPAPAVRHSAGLNMKRLVKLRGRLMALVFAAVFIPAAVAIFLLVPRQYVANAEIEFRSTDPSVRNIEGRSEAGSPAYESYVNTQIDLITGYSILSRVLENEAIKAIPDIANRPDALYYLANNIQTSNENQTERVNFSFRHYDREVALTVLNTVLEEYREYLQEEETVQGSIRRGALVQKEEDLRAELDRQRDQIVALRKELGVPVGETIGDDPTETESYRINLANAEADITRAETATRESEKLVERVQAFLAEYERNPSAPIYALGVEDRVNLDPNVQLLSEQLAEVQQEYAALEETYVAGAPQVKVKASELGGVESKLSQVRSRARGDALRSLLAQHEYEVTSNQATLDDARERRERFASLLKEYDVQKVELSQGVAELAELESRADDTRLALRDLGNLLLNLELESNAPARVNVVGPATADGAPDNTLRLRFLLLALLGSGTLAFGAGLLREMSDQFVRSADDVSHVTDIAVIANIPHATEDRLPENVHVATITADYPASMTADEYRRTVARILYAGRRGGETKTVVIASPARGDGKSTLAANVAVILAQADRKVLLVDVDSRNPSIERAFGLAPSAGLGEMLAGEPMENDPDRSTSYENLFVLGPGLNAGDLLERMASREMADFLEGAEELFDHIIIDTPASLIMSEARLLAPLADGVVVVAGSGITSFGMLRRALNSIQDSGGKIMGIVVNAVRHAPGGYLRRNIELYYLERGHPRTTPGIPRPRRRSAQPSIVLVDEQGERE